MRLALILAVLASTAAWAAAPTRVTLKPEVTVSERVVTLGDIAEIDSSDPVQSRKLAAAVVGPAPTLGQRNRISREEMNLRLRSAGMADGIAWEGADAVTIVRRTASLDGQAVADSATQHLKAWLEPRADRVTLRALPVADLALPAGEVQMRPRTLVATRPMPRMPVWIDIDVDGVFVRSVSVQVEVEAKQRVLVARDDLPAGRRLAMAAFDVQERDVALLRADAVDARSAEGLRLKRPVRAGEALQRDAVEAMPAVSRGDVVGLRASAPMIELQATAIALADAAIGDSLWVRRESNGDSLRAHVVAPGIVEVTLK